MCSQTELVNVYISYAEAFIPYVVSIGKSLLRTELLFDDIDRYWTFTHILPPSSVVIEHDQINIIYTLEWKYCIANTKRLNILYDSYTKLPVPFTVNYTQAICMFVGCSPYMLCNSCIAAKVSIFWTAQLYGEFHDYIPGVGEIVYSSITKNMKLSDGRKCPDTITVYLN